ncbi:MAG: hypothetical protein II336_09870 [Loktanella sp.]|nr:hypothetical protein [Loktanella sp.]
MKFQLFGAFGAIVVLSACGGSSSSENVDARVSLDTLKDRVVVARNTFSFENNDGFDEVTPSAFSQLPAAGSFNYTGVAVVVTGVDTSDDFSRTEFAAIGSSTMNVNFGSQRITGGADNFFELNNPDTAFQDDTLASLQAVTGERIEGALTYQFDQTAQGQNNYSGSITGTLSPRNGQQVAVNQLTEGYFTGAGGEGFIAVQPEEITVGPVVPGTPFEAVGLLMTRD